MGRKSYQHSFAGGEMSPHMLGHIGDEGYRTGFANGRNMLVMPTGAVTKRPQFDFVKEAKAGVSAVRLFPFVYGDGDAYAMEWGPSHVRFHAEGTTLKYATPIPVASVDLATDTFTTVAAHGFAINDAVRITHGNTTIPGSLVTGTTYYVRTIPSATTFTLSASAGPGALFDLTVNSTINDTNFWLQSELPREYVISRTVTRNVNVLDAAAAHGLVTTHGDAVHFTTTGTLPSPLVAGTVYFARYVDSDTFRVATTREEAQTAAVTFTADTGTDTLTATAHGFQDGWTVSLTTSGTLPAPLIATVDYIVTNATANTFQLIHPSVPGVVIDIVSAGGGTHTASPYLVLSSAGSGTHTFHLAYYRGDIVWAGNITVDGSRLFWCFTDLTTSAPNALTAWSQMPHDGTYELSHSFGADALALLNYDQSFDEFSFVSVESEPHQLIRELAEWPSGSSGTADTIRFMFRPIEITPSLGGTDIDSLSRTFGEYYSLTVDGSPGKTFSVAGTANHGIVVGDVLYLEGSIGDANAVTGITGTPGFFLVISTSAQTFSMRSIMSGAGETTNTSGSPQTCVARVVGSSSRISERYVVTALDATGEESIPSGATDVPSILDVPGSSTLIGWSAVAGASRYRLYKEIDEAFGRLTETESLTFSDDNIGPDLDVQPPTYDDALETEYPAAIASFQQRGWLGGTASHGQRVWGSKTGTRFTMSYHERTPLDTDRIQFDVAVSERTLVRHIVPMTHLMLMTSSAEVRVTGANSDVLTPTSRDVRPVTHVGCTGVRPIVRNSSLLFVGASNQHIYELQPQQAVVLPPSDLSVRASHLFDDYTIVQSAQQDSPVPVDWWLRDDGKLLGITNMPEQNIRGWHLHVAAGTDAVIGSICVIPDSDGDRLYAVIARTIDGDTVRHIERMGRIKQPATLAECGYLDSRITYSGAATTTIPVPHLEGETVYAVADGRVRGPFTVTGGSITLPKSASTVHVGIVYDATLRTMPAVVMADGYGKGRQLNVKEATLRIDGSCAFTVGVYSDDGYARTMRPSQGVTNEAIVSMDVAIPVEGSWGRNAQIDIEQSSPLPLTIVSVTLDVEVGGPS